jgi:hypothetical protein
MVIADRPKSYMEDVVSQFQKKHISDFKQDDGALTVSIDAQKPLASSSDKVSQDVKTTESKTSVITDAAISTAKSEIVEEDREYLTHFKSWGKPEARDKPGG